MSLLFVYSLAMTKKCLFPLALALLASCSSPLASSLSSSSEIEVEVPASSSSLEGSSSSEGTTDSDSLGSASSSSLEDVDGEWETIFEKSFEGYEGNELAFFEEGYSTVNSKFGSNYLNLIDPEGYMRTPDIEGLSGEVKVELYCHVTNLNNLTAAAVGETFAFSFSTIAYSIDEDGFSVSDPVDTYSYSHTVTDEDVTNKALPEIPPYTSDFSSEPIVVYLDADGANRILVRMDDKIEFNGQGCNFALGRIVVMKAI